MPKDATGRIQSLPRIYNSRCLINSHFIASDEEYFKCNFCWLRCTKRDEVRFPCSTQETAHSICLVCFERKFSKKCMAKCIICNEEHGIDPKQPGYHPVFNGKKYGLYAETDEENDPISQSPMSSESDEEEDYERAGTWFPDRSAPDYPGSPRPVSPQEPYVYPITPTYMPTSPSYSPTGPAYHTHTPHPNPYITPPTSPTYHPTSPGPSYYPSH